MRSAGVRRTLRAMDLDPHTLQQIIQRIYQQMRCPQCGKRVPVDFTSVRMAADDFLLLQLRCETCDAYIVLHATLQGVDHLKTVEEGMQNVSSSLHLSDDEVKMLHQALQKSGGSFQKLFQAYGKDAKGSKGSASSMTDLGPSSTPDTRIV